MHGSFICGLPDVIIKTSSQSASQSFIIYFIFLFHQFGPAAIKLM